MSTTRTPPAIVPGRFVPNSITLKGQDLKLFAIQFNIYESVLSNAIFADCVLGDAKNLIKELKLRGGETLSVSLQSKHGVSPINFDFILTGIVDRVFAGDREAIYTLKLISPEGFRDASRVAAKRFDGAPLAVLQQVYDEFVSVGKGLDFFGTEAKREEFVFTANNWSGMRCMNFVTKQLAPTGSAEYIPDWLYFQSDKKNYCASLAHMAHVYKSSRTLYDCFQYVPELAQLAPMQRESGWSYIHPYVDAKYHAIDHYSAPTFTDIIQDLNTGFMGNMTVGFDMYKRMPYHMYFDYTPNQALVAGSNALLDKKWDSFFHLDKVNPISDDVYFHPKSTINLLYGNSNLWTDYDFGYDKFHFENTCYRETAVAGFVRNQVDVTIAGRTDVDLGMLVWLRFPDVGPKGQDGGSEPWDKKTTGLYQIVGLRHEFKFGEAFEHVMKMECVRDAHAAK